MIALALSIVVLLFGEATSFEDNNLYGISHVTVVTTNLEVSRRYYTEVLGGMLVDGLSTGPEGVWGDSHFYRIFQDEILEARSTGRSLEDVGVPDISDSGNYTVVWDFILFSNTLIQLMTFVGRFDKNIVFVRTDERRGNAFIGSTHGCFFADDTVVPLQQIQDTINAQNNIPGYPEDYKGFISDLPVTSFEKRRSLSVDKYLFPFGDDFHLATMRGPDAERWEISYIRGSGLKPDLSIYCKEKGVFTLLQDIVPKSRFQNRPSKRNAGLSHINAVVDDYDASIKFYVDVLGGKDNTAKAVRGLPIQAFERVIFQDETLEAIKAGVEPDEFYGIIQGKTGASQQTMDYAFILFDNFYFEPYRYTMNTSYPNVPPYLYREKMSPAFTNNMHTGFWVKDDVPMADFIRKMEADSRRLQLFNVVANRAVNVDALDDSVQDDEYSDPFPDNHKLAGFDYVYFKGPSGEQLVLTKFLGKARATLQAAMEMYGAVSTAFSSTNPWNWKGFDRKCKWMTQED